MNSKGLNAMPVLLKFLVPLAIFLSRSYAHAFTSLSPVAGNKARVNHLIQFEEPMSNPTNESSREPIRKPTNDQMINDQTTIPRLEWDAELPNILSPKRGKYSLSQKQDAELPSKITISTTQFTSELKCGVHPHWVIAKSSSKRVGNIAFTQPQSAKAASKATADMQASADSNKMPSIFQLIVGSKQTYRRKPQQDLVDSSSSKTIIFETSDAFSRRLIVTFIKPNANFPLSKLSLQSAPNSLLKVKVEATL
jgi:hypothetical protein